MRNTRVVDVIDALRRYKMKPIIVDPWVDRKEADRIYNIEVFSSVPPSSVFNVVLAAVAHKEFTEFSADTWKQLLMPNGLLLDLKGIISRELAPLRL